MAEVKPLSVWLTREEMLTVYAYQLVAHIYPAYGAEQMSEAEREAIFIDSLGNAMRWAISELIDRGFHFTGIAKGADGQLRLTVPEIVCAENVLLLGKLARGKMLSPIASISTALIEFEKRRIEVDVGPMVDVLIQCQEDAKAARQIVEGDPELVAVMDEFFTKALAAAGYVAGDRKRTLH